MTVPLIETDVLQAALDRALRRRRRLRRGVRRGSPLVSSGRFDDGRVEELVSGRDRGAGLRVVRGDTTGFAHTADLSREPVLPRPPKRRRPRPAAVAAERGRSRWHAGSRRRIAADVQLPETVDEGAQGRAAAPRRRRGAGAEGDAIRR